MPNAYAVTIERTIVQTITLVRSGNEETAQDRAWQEAHDDSPYLGWETKEVQYIDVMGAELVGQEHDD